MVGVGEEVIISGMGGWIIFLPLSWNQKCSLLDKEAQIPLGGSSRVILKSFFKLDLPDLDNYLLSMDMEACLTRVGHIFELLSATLRFECLSRCLESKTLSRPIV